MRKIFILIGFYAFVISGFSQTRDLGLKTFINSDGKINIAVKAFYLAKDLEQKEYLPFLVYAGCDSGLKSTFERLDVVLKYEGKKYFVPNLKDFRQNYKGDVADLTYLGIIPNNVFPSEMGNYTFQKDVNFFPPRNSGSLYFTEKVSINSRTGFSSIIYFKNPGIKTGDKAILEITDHEDKTISGAVELQF